MRLPSVLRGRLVPLLLLFKLVACGPSPWIDQKSARLRSEQLSAWLERDNDVQLQGVFRSWSSSHERDYAGDDERLFRFAVFKNNLHRISRINQRQGLSYWAGVNGLADKTPEEFQAMLGTRLPPGMQLGGDGGDAPAPVPPPAPAASRRMLQAGDGAGGGNDEDPPVAVDWVAAGMVTPPKRQGPCGACWAFAAVAALESRYLTKVGRIFNFSEQIMIDCVDKNMGYATSDGCGGGWPSDALNFAYRFGVSTELRYPYTGAKGSCARDLFPVVTATREEAGYSAGYRRVPKMSVRDLMKAVAVTPVVVAFNAEAEFQFFSGGLYPASDCSTDTINHAVVVVGYNSAPPEGPPYWLLKNSWGEAWGEGGYMRVEMTPDGPGPCGLYYYAYTPLLQ